MRIYASTKIYRLDRQEDLHLCSNLDHVPRPRRLFTNVSRYLVATCGRRIVSRVPQARCTSTVLGWHAPPVQLAVGSWTKVGPVAPTLPPALPGLLRR